MTKFLVTSLILISVYYFQVSPHAIQSPPEQLQMIRKVTEACAKETAVKEDLVLKARKGDFSDDNTFKEYVMCTMKKYNIVKDGKINKEAIDKHVVVTTGDPDFAKKTYNKCHQEKDNLVNTVFEMMKCYFKELPVSVV